MGYRTLLVMIAVLVGIIVALTTGILMRVNGSNLATAVISGGSAFAVAVTLVLLTAGYLDGSS